MAMNRGLEHMLSRPRAARLALIVIIAAILWGVGIWRINATAPHYASERYGMNDPVALDGAFLDSSFENTGGYLIEVRRARVMSSKSYVREYGSSGSGRASSSASLSDERSVVVLEMLVEHKGSEEGFFNIMNSSLVPGRNNFLYRADIELWKLVEPRAQPGVKLEPNSSIVIHMPYSAGFSRHGNLYREKVEDRSFLLEVSAAPMRKVIEVSAS